MTKRLTLNQRLVLVECCHEPTWCDSQYRPVRRLIQLGFIERSHKSVTRCAYYSATEAGQACLDRHCRIEEDPKP